MPLSTRIARTVATIVLMTATLSDNAAQAQPHGNGYLVVNGRCWYRDCAGELLRVNASGAAATLTTWSGLSPFASVTMDHRNRTALLLTSYLSYLVAYDLTTSTSLRVAIPAPYYWSGRVEPAQSGGIAMVAVDTGYTHALIRLDPALRVVTKVRSMPPTGSQLIGRDLATGDYVVGTQQGTMRISPDGSAMTTLTSFFASCGAQSHYDGSWFLSSANSILRVAPNRTVTTVVSNGPYYSVRFDRATGQGALSVIQGSSTLASSLLQLDANGSVLTSMQPGAFTMRDHRHYRDRNVATERLAANNRWAFHVSFPGEQARPFVLALSATGFSPGVRIGGRVLSLTPDALTWASISGGLGNLLVGASGALSSLAEATATLDLRRFGQALRGRRLWATAVTLDPNAPGGIATIARPVVLVLE